MKSSNSTNQSYESLFSGLRPDNEGEYKPRFKGEKEALFYFFSNSDFLEDIYKNIIHKELCMLQEHCDETTQNLNRHFILKYEKQYRVFWKFENEITICIKEVEVIDFDENIN